MLTSCFPESRSSLSDPYRAMWSTADEQGATSRVSQVDRSDQVQDRYSLCLISSLAIAASMCFIPPASRISFVEKLVWHPAPFQSPSLTIFGWNVT